MKKMLCSMTAALLLPAGMVWAVNLPEMQEGLWSMRTQEVNNPGNKREDTTAFSFCRNHAYDKEAEVLAKGIKGCTIVSENFAGGKYSTEMRCVIEKAVVAGKVLFEKTVVVTKGTATQSSTAAHIETHTTYAPAMFGVSDKMSIMDQTYVGSCPSGMRPGDALKPDGTIVHR
jgi:hypothetical protein